MGNAHHNISTIFVSCGNNCFVSENRYILFLTENYAALDILKNPKSYLEEGLSMSGGDGATSDVQPFILFGSSFPKDKEYTQVSDVHSVIILF